MISSIYGDLQAYGRGANATLHLVATADALNKLLKRKRPPPQDIIASTWRQAYTDTPYNISPAKFPPDSIACAIPVGLMCHRMQRQLYLHTIAPLPKAYDLAMLLGLLQARPSKPKQVIAKFLKDTKQPVGAVVTQPNTLLAAAHIILRTRSYDSAIACAVDCTVTPNSSLPAVTAAIAAQIYPLPHHVIDKVTRYLRDTYTYERAHDIIIIAQRRATALSHQPQLTQ